MATKVKKKKESSEEKSSGSSILGFNMALARRLKQKLKERGKTPTQEQIDAETNKAKNRPMAHVRIDRDGNRCVAKGNDAEFEDDSMSRIMSLSDAEAAIKAGTAKAGEGW